MGTAIVWFRRDLRVSDHPALDAARRSAERLVPFFCFDDRLLHGRHASGPRTQFMLDCLRDLAAALEKRGTRLVVRSGAPERELRRLVDETEADSVHFSADVTPFARSRDERVARTLDGVAELVAHAGLYVADRPEEIRTARGTPQTVFSPYHRAWTAQPRREVAPTPRTLPPLPHGLATGELPCLDDLGLEQHVERPAEGGERAGRKRMKAFLAGAIREYADDRDALGRDSASRLSPYLRFGCISPRELEARLPRGAVRTPSAASSAGGTSTPSCSSTIRATRGTSSASATGTRSNGAPRTSTSTPGARAGPAFRWSTRGCVSSAPKAGCTTERGSSPARS
jgi:deoxyribodipyrimidine photo-lyase